MKPRQIARLSADALMTLALLFLMGYQFWGEAAHEWAGVGMFALFILHHVLNLGWHKRLFRGKYTRSRLLMLCINALMLLAMLALMFSGVVMSRHAFALLPIKGGLALARRLHILGAYWGFILMSLHLGLHWSSLLGLIKARVKPKPSRPRRIACFILSAAIAACGLIAFIRRDFADYLFLRSEFVFLDYGESKLSFYLDELSLMGLCTFIAHYSAKLCRRKKHA